MGYRRMVLVSLLAAVVFLPAAARSADEDELKATFEQAVAAINQKDLDGLAASWHDKVVAFNLGAPFAAVGKAADRQVWQTLFANSDSVTFTPLNPQYQVIGMAGIVWGHIAVAIKPKDGPMQTTFGRLTLMYVKTDGKWQLVAVHGSPIPSGN